jgi:hypothetical protein
MIATMSFIQSTYGWSLHDEAVNDRGKTLLTHSSCCGVSIAPGRAARTRSIAALGSTPDSTNRRAEIMPALPRRPRQCTTMFSPSSRRLRRRLLCAGHCSSNYGPGVPTSRIGRCSHSMPRC